MQQHTVHSYLHWLFALAYQSVYYANAFKPLPNQGSTELWEWDTSVAAEAFALHDTILRAYMSRFFGYEVRRGAALPYDDFAAMILPKHKKAKRAVATSKLAAFACIYSF